MKIPEHRRCIHDRNKNQIGYVWYSGPVISIEGKLYHCSDYDDGYFEVVPIIVEGGIHYCLGDSRMSD